MPTTLVTAGQPITPGLLVTPGIRGQHTPPLSPFELYLLHALAEVCLS